MTEERAQPGRRFTLLDAMVLVAATAIGLAGYRAVLSSGNVR